MTHEELQELLNTDLTQPHPDPSWDYYSLWNALLHVKNKIEALISEVSQIENADKQSDLNLASKITNLRGYLDALEAQLSTASR